MDKLNTPLYQLNTSITQTDTGGGTVQFRLTATSGTRLVIQSIYAKGTSLASSRIVTIEHLDENHERVLYLAGDSTFSSGGYFNYPAAGSNASNSGNFPRQNDIILANNDYIRIIMYSAAQNEGFEKIQFRAFIKGKQPSIQSSGSGGSVSISTNANIIV